MPATSSAPLAAELVLLRQSTREAVTALHAGLPDDQWPHTWAMTWNQLAQYGLWSTLQPPDGTLTAAAAVVEELGRALYPGPACDVLAATYVLARTDDGGLPVDVAGGAPSAVACTGDLTIALGPAPRAHGLIDPSVAVLADTLLIVLNSGDALVAIPAGAADIEPMPALDVSRRISALRVDDLPVTVLRSADPAVVQAGRAARTALYCADTLGCVEHVLGRAVEYAGQRITFGKSLGQHQAVAHRLVDHAITAQQMRLLLAGALAAFDEDPGNVAVPLGLAETFITAHAATVISDCIQLTGAIGFTWELGHHFYLRRVLANAVLASSPGRPAQRLTEVVAW